MLYKNSIKNTKFYFFEFFFIKLLYYIKYKIYYYVRNTKRHNIENIMFFDTYNRVKNVMAN